MIIISDSSVLMNLAAIKRLHLLPAIFDEITIPNAVYEEIVVLGEGKIGSLEVRDATWIKVQKCTDLDFLNELKKALDNGEAEAIVLSKELNSDLLIIDEKRGREIALRHKIKITGLLGVLLIAKSKKLIPEIKPLLVQLREDVNFYIAQKTFDMVLEKANES